MDYKEIYWERTPLEGALENRGTNGHGLIAKFEVVGIKGRFVNLSFQCFIDDDRQLIQGDDLAIMAQAIGKLIHCRLGV